MEIPHTDLRTHTINNKQYFQQAYFFQWEGRRTTVKQEMLAAIIFGGFENIIIW